ncbi:MAG TPA: DUF2271 domain-containing protein [Kofleriaceae bacterium]|nr:DUF2271 domain-containing protein [Kofleriaceae bacterium]
MRALIAIIVTALAAPAAAQSVSATFTTTPAGGSYQPKNIVAVWVEDGTGAFQKTIGRWAATRKQYLLTWNQKAGTNDADAVSGATRANHNGTLTVTWDLKNKSGTVVPDGTYTIRMELADSNATSTAQLHEGTFTFTKGSAPQMQSALSNGGFNGVSINFSPTAACSNGVVDPGETCDPPGSCPTTCAAPADACMPSVLVGDAATCTAACQVQPITACAAGDGCCPAGCDTTSDTDCGAGGGGGGNNDLSGGCDAGRGSGVLLVLVGLAITAGRRRSRRTA